MNEYLPLIEKSLKKYLPDDDNVVSEAMRYSIENGGKRIRPLLTLEFCKICGGKAEDALPFACALEMIHTYSLIHDDLPCMDNDDFRRGKPSCHVAYGYEYALLAGDALLTIAFETAASYKGKAETALKAIRLLAQASGCRGMIEGQMSDLQNEGKRVAIETVIGTDRKKTGELIRAACILGCLAAGCEEKTALAEAFASDIGLAFQIVDDILDVTSDTETLGKPVGSDNENEKCTYVSLLGLDGARAEVARLTEHAKETLDGFDGDVSDLKTFAEKLKNRQK